MDITINTCLIPCNINNGNGKFSEIAQLSGVSNTDWSWSPLFADFDNDGYKDLMVTNGLFRDMRNNDTRIATTNYVQRQYAEAQAKGIQNFRINPLDLIKRAKSVPIDNFIYKNNGDLTFSPTREEWGFNYKGFSQGAAYADFDNDGDIDVVMNNLNANPVIFQNNLASKSNNFIRLHLIGDRHNPDAIGAQATVITENEKQIQQNFPVRGFMSCSERTLHFGIGAFIHADKIIVRWPDGRESLLSNVKGNQVVEINQSDASAAPKDKVEKELFVSKTKKLKGLRHVENKFDDYEREILIPHRMSTLGPALTTGDVNNDGLEDFYIGGASGSVGVLMIQGANQSFRKSNQNGWSQDAVSEDVGALFFDADGDNDLDLYVVSGGNEFDQGNKAHIDRLYLNNGKGHFSKSKQALPNAAISGSCVIANDFDRDGDQDLFIGGRQVPGKYGHPASSRLLQNNNGKFTDITSKSCAEWNSLGMVTDAIWIDFDDDEQIDLVIAGEWMPITFYKNDKGSFVNATEQYGTGKTTGWWNKLAAVDVDSDGDLDLVAGNLGLNIKYKSSESEPFKLFVKDFDGNGSNDVYLGYYDRDGICYPVRGRECSSQQLPFVKEKIPNIQ